jgi:hypothetical protein
MTIASPSIFDGAPLCMECAEDERHAPGFARALDVMKAAFRDTGDICFHGLSQRDAAFLAARRKSRLQALILLPADG